MKNEGKIIAITLINCILAVLFFSIYLIKMYLFQIEWYYSILIILGFFIILALVDIIVLGIVWVVQNGYGKILFLNIIIILLFFGTMTLIVCIDFILLLYVKLIVLIVYFIVVVPAIIIGLVFIMLKNRK